MITLELFDPIPSKGRGLLIVEAMLAVGEGDRKRLHFLNELTNYIGSKTKK